MWPFRKKKEFGKNTINEKSNTELNLNFEEEKYQTSDNEKDYLHFDHLNFKLAIIQVLMYDLYLLKPEFNIYEFAEQNPDIEIDTESETVIQPSLDFFQNLVIPKKFAHYVKEIYMDGGNDLYMNIIPQWDGEDEFFDLNEISLSELEQFPNLTKATLMSSNFEHVQKIFESQNISVELL